MVYSTRTIDGDYLQGFPVHIDEYPKEITADKRLRYYATFTHRQNLFG